MAQRLAIASSIGRDHHRTGDQVHDRSTAEPWAKDGSGHWDNDGCLPTLRHSSEFPTPCIYGPCRRAATWSPYRRAIFELDAPTSASRRAIRTSLTTDRRGHQTLEVDGPFLLPARHGLPLLALRLNPTRHLTSAEDT